MSAKMKKIVKKRNRQPENGLLTEQNLYYKWNRNYILFLSFNVISLSEYSKFDGYRLDNVHKMKVLTVHSIWIEPF